MKRIHVVFLIIFLVLLIDQTLKIWIKTTFTLGEEIYPLGVENDWMRLHFTENKGMAFGIIFGGEYGKLALSLFRLVAVGVMFYYLFQLIKQQAHRGLIYSLAFILAGALGNIIDSAFYGLIFSKSTFYEVATFMPENGGYEKFLHGWVVDMLYFPMFKGQFPSWFPIWGDKHYLFFRPVFNIADSAITVGVLTIILFQKRFFAEPQNTPPTEADHTEADALVESGNEPTTEEVEDAADNTDNEAKNNEEDKIA